MRLVLMGPPGAGKGTQAVELSREYSVPHISTGDMFRAAVASGTELGMEARRYMDAGRLVPDDVTLGIVRERLSERDAACGFVLDGFPRTVPQARELQEVLASGGLKLDGVITIDVPDGELVRRAVGRRVCPQCGRAWHVEFNPPPSDACSCGGELVQRDDDRADTVMKRLETYREQTEPLKDFYAGLGLLVSVDGTGGPESVHKRISDALRRCNSR
ncbi:MAG TPA: adenylate kinase [Firmicutes bacterium]|jgi:adenylate kinase|nr:adenylate kinase [Bacillota bacterium]